MLCSGCSHLRFAIFTPSISHDRSTQKENTMTNIYVSYKTIAVAAVVAFGAIAFSSLSANASATGDLRLCHANSKQKFVKCCETVISHQGKPLWFVESNSSCKSVVVCRKILTKAPVSFVAMEPYRCNLSIPQPGGQGGQNNIPQRGNTQE